MTDEDKKAYADRKCPKKCLNCEHRKIITHGVLPYNFCKKLNVSFTKNEPDDFFELYKVKLIFRRAEHGRVEENYGYSAA